jgi:hypothetical protein
VASRVLEAGDPGKFVIMDAANSEMHSKFRQMQPVDRVADNIHRVADSSFWLKLSSAERVDREYADVLATIIRDLGDAAGLPLVEEITWSSLTIFVAAPGVVTPYHIDHESNCLLQVFGEKDVMLFDPFDRSVLREAEIERFYIRDSESAELRENAGAKAQAFRLSPGLAVHHPPLAPHWVRNGAEVSVSVSVGFALRELDARAKVFQMNHVLRSAGLQPRAPGHSRVADRLKAALLGALTPRRPRNREQEMYAGYERLTAVPRLMARLLRRRRAVKQESSNPRG